MKHRATQRVWRCYHALPEDVRRLADHGFETLKRDARHPSLQLKKVGRFWSVRVGMHYRALAIESQSDLLWFWTGSHSEYDRLVGQI